LFESSGPEFQA